MKGETYRVARFNNGEFHVLDDWMVVTEEFGRVFVAVAPDAVSAVYLAQEAYERDQND